MIINPSRTKSHASELSDMVSKVLANLAFHSNSLTTYVLCPAGKKEVIDYHSSKIFRFSIVIGNLRFADMISDIITIK